MPRLVFTFSRTVVFFFFFFLKKIIMIILALSFFFFIEIEKFILFNKKVYLSKEPVIYTPFFRSRLVASNCGRICLRRLRLGSNRIFLPASIFEMFTSIEPTCSKGSSASDSTEKRRKIIVT